MRVRLSIRIPSSSGAAVARKATLAYARAIASARAEVTRIVVERASEAADKAVPDFAPRYRKALRGKGAVEVSEKEVSVTITDPVVVAVERGAKAFDMKPALLARGKASKGGGVYADVPLRHKAGSVPQAMRTAMRRAAGGQPGEVRLAAKTEGKSFARNLHRGPIAQALGRGPRPQQVRHKRGIHDDMTRRSTRTRGGGWSASYSTVRRVSSKSPASSWWHPGFKARRVLDDVLPRARREIAAAISGALART